MQVDERLKKQLPAVFRSAFGQEWPENLVISFQETKKEFDGDRTLVVFPLAKPLKTKPEAIGEALGEALKGQAPELVSDYSVVKGFLNLSLTQEAWLLGLKSLPEFLQKGHHPATGEQIMVEFSSPNTNKPLHLGHLRNNFLGDAVSRILKAAGHQVVRANLVNNRGIHICKSMIAYKLFGQGEESKAGRKGDHLVGDYYVRCDREHSRQKEAMLANGASKQEAESQTPIMQQARQMLLDWEAQDPETLALWKQMNHWVMQGFEETYRRTGIHFDKYYFESDTYRLGKDVIEEGLEKGVFYRKADGSVWADLSDIGLDEKLVLRSDGTSVYITQDLGTADLKYREFQCNRSIYVVGDEQEYHFKVLFELLKRLERPYAEGLYHLSYGMVDLPTGRMKTREGTVVDADELIDEMVATARQRTEELSKNAQREEVASEALYEMIGIGGLKFFLLKVEPKKRMVFNPEESIELQGFTATFIQYTHARNRSVLRFAAQEGLLEADAWTHFELHELSEYRLGEKEKELIAMLMAFPDRIREAAAEYSPATIAHFIYHLAKTYNQFYDHHSILKAETEAVKRLRITLTALHAETLRQGMQLLGIEVPERM